jgi:RHS repeat-associated protein
MSHTRAAYTGSKRKQRAPATRQGASIFTRKRKWIRLLIQDYGYSYDTAGRLISQTMPDSKCVAYQLDANGNRTRLTYPDNYYAEYVYDQLNRLTDIKLNGSTSAAVHLDYDDLSRRTGITYENGCESACSYELNDDLASLEHSFVGSSVAYAFSYNQVHQLTAMSVDNDEFAWTPAASSMTNYGRANNLNQYPTVGSTSYSYNSNGCQTAGMLTASFDVLNRMTQAVSGSTTVDYWNDPTNRQAQKSVNSVKTGLLYDGQQLIAEYDNSGDLANRYIRGNRLDEVFIKIAGSTKTYLHHDRLGSVIAQTDDSGAVLNVYKYGPFGETASLTGTPFGYTGQRFDAEIGLYNYKARYYAPAIGRFLQPDPIGMAGGMNLYSYVGNDAVNLVDPMGLQAAGQAACPGQGGGGGGGQTDPLNSLLNSLMQPAGAQTPGTGPTANDIAQWAQQNMTRLAQQGGGVPITNFLDPFNFVDPVDIVNSIMQIATNPGCWDQAKTMQTQLSTQFSNSGWQFQMLSVDNPTIIGAQPVVIPNVHTFVQASNPTTGESVYIDPWLGIVTPGVNVAPIPGLIHPSPQ